MKKISRVDWPTGDTSCFGKQISVHTRELVNQSLFLFTLKPWEMDNRRAQYNARYKIGVACLIKPLVTLLPNLPKETRSDYVRDVQTLVFICFFLSYA